MSDAGPRTVAGYEVLRELGRGGGGRVYLARDPALGREVALKVLNPELLLAPDAEARFRREAQALAALAHPNVVPVHRFDRDPDGRLYLVLQAIAGEPLDRLLAARPLSVRHVAEIAAGVARGLAAAHDRGILHRDVKPANVIVGADGKPVLIDFGLALAESDDRVTAASELVGTRAYAAPELLERRSRAATAASDVYALGALLHEALTLVPPGEPPLAPRALRREVPRALDAIVRKATARDPRERHSTARELAQDLDAFLAGRPVSARPPSVVVEALRRARVPLLVAALVFGGALAERLLRSDPPRPPPPGPADSPAVSVPAATRVSFRGPAGARVSVRALGHAGPFEDLGALPLEPRPFAPGALVVRVEAAGRHPVQWPVFVELRPDLFVVETPDLPAARADRADMVHVPATEAVLGGAAVNALSIAPIRTRVAAFWIDRREVLAGDVTAFRGSSAYDRRELWTDEGWTWKGRRSARRLLDPVVAAAHVTRHEAHAYSRWRGLRLPTEVEWEVAARGPSGLAYPWGDDAVDELLATPAAPRAPGAQPRDESPWGCLDLGGNVAEWTASFFVALGHADPRRAIVKGGGAGFAPELGLARGAARATLAPEDDALPVGFRCAASD